MARGYKLALLLSALGTAPTGLACAQPVFSKAGGISGGAAMNWAIAANGTAQFKSLIGADISSALIAINGGSERTAAARFADELNVKDGGAVGDGVTDDTAALQTVFAIAQNRLNMGLPTGLWIPPGRMVISQTLKLTVPAGGHLSIRGLPGASEFATTFAGDALQITTTGTGSQNSPQISLTGIGAIKLAQAPAGGEAFEILGTSPIPEVKIRNLRCDAPYGAAVTWGGTSTPWHSCVHLQNVVRSDIDGIISQNNGVHTGDPNQGIGLWMDAAGGLYSIDNHVEHLQIVDGFAGVMVTGHVEGLTIGQSTLLGNAYNLYAPGRSYPNKDSNPQFLLFGTVSNSHLNSFLRGIYVVNGGSIHSDHNLYYNAGWSADGTPTNIIAPPASAWLPIDTTLKNPTSVSGGYTFAGLDCINCNDTISTGDELNGNNAPYSDAIRFTLLSFDSTTDTSGAQVVAADDIHNFQGAAVAIGSGVVNNVVSGIRTSNVSACLASSDPSTISVGCTRNGSIEGIGYQNGTSYLNGNLWAGNGTLTVSTGGIASLSGTFTAGGLVSVNNVQAGKYSSFITTDASGNSAGYLTNGGNGLLAAGTFTSGGRAGFSGDYLIANKAITGPGSFGVDGSGNLTAPTVTFGTTLTGGTGAPISLTDPAGKNVVSLSTMSDGTLGIAVNANGAIPGITTGLGNFSKRVQTGSYTVASLPTGCTVGSLAYATDGRKSGEAAGAGSGTEVVCSRTAPGGAPTWLPIATQASAVQN